MGRTKSFKTSALDNMIAEEGQQSPAPSVVSSTEGHSGHGKGRPQIYKNERRSINVKIDVDLLNKLETVRSAYGNNLTKYIEKLIRKDLDANYKKYLERAQEIDE